MVHNEHNKSINSGGFALIILGALLLYLAPTTIYPNNPELGIMSLIGGIIIGGIGFYLRYIRTREQKT